MKRAYTFQEVREADQRKIEGGMSVNLLMQNAGELLAEAVRGALIEQNVTDVLFVCGGGNNGGDGFVAARILAESGIDVQVLCVASHFSDACREAKEKFGGEILSRIPKRRYAVIVDCLLGTGIDRPAEEWKEVIGFINDSGAYVLSCDVPSGLTDGGIACGPCVRADATVCMGALKTALLLADGADLAGNISLADIGIEAEGGAEIWEKEDVLALFPPKPSHSDKGMYGSAAVLAGEMPGAALLSAEACLRTGAGYTKCYFKEITQEGLLTVSSRMPSCIFRSLSWEELLSCDAVAYGMGAGTSEATYQTVLELLSRYEGTLILDADALNSLSRYGMRIKDRRCKLVLTPHPKEFSRMTGKTVEELLQDPIGQAKAFAGEYGAVVLFKNNRTVITDGERTAVNVTGSPVLARGGSGDVLSGLLSGLSARLSPYEAACAASWLLGKAGEEAAARWGEYSPAANDIISCIPRVLHG